MLAIEITLNVFTLIGSVLAAALVGFVFRTAQLKSLHRKVKELESEMLIAHAEVLETQQQKVALEQQLKGSSPIPVIPIKTAEEKNAENKGDLAMRKKMMPPKSADKHS